MAGTQIIRFGMPPGQRHDKEVPEHQAATRAGPSPTAAILCVRGRSGFGANGADGGTSGC
jgi:hypothetical protein